MEVSAKGGHVAICENETVGIHFKTLIVKLHDEDLLTGFQLPAMRHIVNTISKGTIVISLLHEPLRNYFNSFLDSFIQEVTPNDSSIKLLNRIQAAFGKLKKLIELEPMLSHEQCKGLYAELFYICQCLNRMMDPLEIVEAWLGPDRTAQDFVFADETVEIKAIARTANRVTISSEHQLEARPGIPLRLMVNKIETISHTNTDSLAQLYREITSRLGSSAAIRLFEEKCEAVGTGYYGPDNASYPYRFNVIDTAFYNVDQIHFPRLSPGNLPTGIGNVSWTIDLSVMEGHKVII